MDVLPVCLLKYVCKFMNVATRLKLSRCNKKLYDTLKLTREECFIIMKSSISPKIKNISTSTNECLYCKNKKNRNFSIRLLNNLSIDICGTENIYDYNNDVFKKTHMYTSKYKYICEHCISYPHNHINHYCNACYGLIRYERCNCNANANGNSSNSGGGVSCILKCNGCNIDMEITINKTDNIYVVRDRKDKCFTCNKTYDTSYIMCSINKKPHF